LDFQWWREVVRYFSRHGGKGVSKAVLSFSYAISTANRLNQKVFLKKKYDGMAKLIKEDRLSFLDNFGKRFSA
jgi:uncharacterized protein YneR